MPGSEDCAATQRPAAAQTLRDVALAEADRIREVDTATAVTDRETSRKQVLSDLASTGGWSGLRSEQGKQASGGEEGEQEKEPKLPTLSVQPASTPDAVESSTLGLASEESYSAGISHQLKDSLDFGTDVSQTDISPPGLGEGTFVALSDPSVKKYGKTWEDARPNTVDRRFEFDGAAVLAILFLYDPEAFAFWTHTTSIGTNSRGEIPQRVHGWLRVGAANAGFWQHETGDVSADGPYRPIIELSEDATLSEAVVAISTFVRKGTLLNGDGKRQTREVGFGIFTSGLATSNVDAKQFKEWQRLNLGIAAEKAAFYAELYIKGVVSISEAGELVVSLAEWSQGDVNVGNTLGLAIPFVPVTMRRAADAKTIIGKVADVLKLDDKTIDKLLKLSKAEQKQLASRLAQLPAGATTEARRLIDEALNAPRVGRHSYPSGTATNAARKAHRTAVARATWSNHNFKHLKARSLEAAMNLSRNGGAAQYLPGINNKALEKLATQVGFVIEHGQTKYFYYQAKDIIGYDNGTATRWIRAEISSGVYHGHPMRIDRLPKAVRDAFGL